MFRWTKKRGITAYSLIEHAPRMDAADEVVIANGGQGLDLRGCIGSYGVQFNVGRDYTQGTGAAVRTLVELATIELVGK